MVLLRLDGKKLETLHLIARKGAENATLAISRWLKEKVKMAVLEVKITQFSDMPNIIGGSDTIAVGTMVRIQGDVTGNILFIFSEANAFSLTHKILKDKASSKMQWEPIDISIIEETANIVGSAFINAMVSYLDIDMKPTSPAFMRDYTGAIMQLILMEYAEVGDDALFFEIKFFEPSENIDGYLFLLPSPDSLRFLLRKIGLE